MRPGQVPRLPLSRNAASPLPMTVEGIASLSKYAALNFIHLIDRSFSPFRFWEGHYAGDELRLLKYWRIVVPVTSGESRDHEQNGNFISYLNSGLINTG